MIGNVLRSKRFRAGLFTVVMAAAVIVGALALVTEAQAAPRCICPQVYAPVVCDNGQTYPNLCVANCKHATGCEPVIILPPPI